MTFSRRLFRSGLPLLILLALAAMPAFAQEGAAGLSGQSLRPYRFVFIAYAILWVMVLGWVVSIARRMARLDRRLGSDTPQ
jgi:CcmD family protein